MKPSPTRNSRANPSVISAAVNVLMSRNTTVLIPMFLSLSDSPRLVIAAITLNSSNGTTIAAIAFDHTLPNAAT